MVAEVVLVNVYAHWYVSYSVCNGDDKDDDALQNEARVALAVVAEVLSAGTRLVLPITQQVPLLRN